MPLVSIITPTYNRPEWLGEAIASVLAQSFEDWEMLVVDDGSEPSAQSVVDSFNDTRLRCLRLNHVGRSAARNHGLELARGEYVGFLDDDDLFHPTKLDLEVAFLKTHPEIDIVGSGYRVTYNDGTAPLSIYSWEYRTEITIANCLFGIPLITCSMLIRRRAVEQMSRWFNPALDIGEDSDFLRRLFLTGVRFDWLEEVLSDYRQLREKDHTYIPEIRHGFRESLRLIFQMNNLPEEIAGRHRDALVYYDLMSAWRAYASQVEKTAQWLLLQALAQEPRLAGEKARFLLDELGTFASNTVYINDPIGFFDYVLAHLPTPLRHLAQQSAEVRRQIMAKHGN